VRSSELRKYNTVFSLVLVSRVQLLTKKISPVEHLLWTLSRNSIFWYLKIFSVLSLHQSCHKGEVTTNVLLNCLFLLFCVPCLAFAKLSFTKFYLRINFFVSWFKVHLIYSKEDIYNFVDNFLNLLYILFEARHINAETITCCLLVLNLFESLNFCIKFELEFVYYIFANTWGTINCRGFRKSFVHCMRTTSVSELSIYKICWYLAFLTLLRLGSVDHVKLR